MKKIINWNPSETLRRKAVKVAELKESITYREVAKIFPYTKRYLQELNYLGKRIKEEIHD